MSERSRFNVIIVGAGITGLAAAVALGRKGHRVTVLDYRTKLKGTIGFGILSWSNATRVLFKFDLWPRLQQVMLPPPTIHYRKGDTGEILVTRGPDDFVGAYGFPHFNIMREDYVKVLMETAKEHGVDVRLGVGVERVDEAEAQVTLATGETLKADLIVGADGINSTTRKFVLPGQEFPLSSSINAYRFSIPEDIVRADEKVAHVMETHDLWFGPDRLVVAGPLRGYYSATLPHPGIHGTAGAWNKPGDLAEMRKLYEGFNPVVRRLLEHVEFCTAWKIAELPDLPRKLSESDKVILIGDAAHAMMPYAAQGGSQGVEDAACLAECLDRASSTIDIPKILKAFEAIRKPRTDKVREHSRENVRRMSQAGEVKKTPAHAAGAAGGRKPSAPPDDTMELEGLHDWLLAYDVFEDVSCPPQYFRYGS